MSHIAKLVFSIETTELARSPSQYDAVNTLLQAQGCIFEETLGSYIHTNGTRVTEPSFVVLWTNETAFKTVEQIARLYGQESILLVDSDKKTYLRFLDENPNLSEKFLGEWTKVEQIKDLDETNPYTKIGDNYFITK